MTSTLATVRRFSDAGPRFERRKPRTPREVHLPRVSSSPRAQKTLLGPSRVARLDRAPSAPRDDPRARPVPFPSDALVTFPIRIRAWNGSPRRRCLASRTARSRPFPRLGRHPPRCRPTATRRFARAVRRARSVFRRAAEGDARAVDGDTRRDPPRRPRPRRRAARHRRDGNLGGGDGCRRRRAGSRAGGLVGSSVEGGCSPRDGIERDVSRPVKNAADDDSAVVVDGVPPSHPPRRRRRRSGRRRRVVQTPG